MKIQGTGSTSKTDKSKKSSKSSSGSGVFGTMLTASDIPETSSMAQSQAVTNVEALLAAQAVFSKSISRPRTSWTYCII